MSADKIREYAIVGLPLKDVPAETYNVLFKTRNFNALYQEVAEHKYDDTTSCIEYYFIDGEGHFLEGSDYDSISHFLSAYNDPVYRSNYSE